MLLDPLQSRALFADALERGYAVLAVNADSPAAISDCLEAARQADAPLIIETSLWQLTGRSFGVGDAALGMARYLVQLAVLADSPRYADLPVVFHTDHIKGAVTLPLLTAAVSGLPVRFGDQAVTVAPSTVSLDSSELTEGENISTIRTLCDAAAAADRAITVEMEVGIEDGLTPPDVTRRLLGAVEETHPGSVWLWAPGLGTRHGLAEAAAAMPAERRAEQIRAQHDLAASVTGRPIGLALHGSSGLSDEALSAAAAAGVVKVNWSSESLLVRSRAAAAYYRALADRLDGRHPGFKAAAMDDGVQAAVAAGYVPIVAARMATLNGAGMAAGAMRRIRESSCSGTPDRR